MEIKSSILVKKLAWGIGIAALAISGCEKPNSPDFKLQQQLQAPVLYNKTFKFLGDKNALVDTTSSNFDSLFTVGSEGMVRLTKQEDINIGNLNEAIPQINIADRQLGSKVGPIKFQDFASGSRLGEATFQDITGQPSSAVSQGTTIPTGSASGIPIPLNTEYLQSATVESGGVQISLQNELGFDISSLTLRLMSNGSQVGNTLTFSTFNYGTSVSGTIQFSKGDVLQNLNVQVSASWGTQTMQANAGSLVVDNVLGQDLYASQVRAVVPSQTFYSTMTASIDSTDFRFQAAQDYVQLKSGTVQVSNLVNSLDLSLDTLRVSFPGIVLPDANGNYQPADSLVLNLTSQGVIDRNSTVSSSTSADLAGARIYAPGNVLPYHVVSSTVDSRNTTDSIRTVQAQDSVSAHVSLQNLDITEARGVVVPRTIAVTDDDPANGLGKVDLFKDTEAETISIDGISDFSRQLHNISFKNATMSVQYTTNIGVPGRVYGAIVGTDANGNEVYLQPKTGGPYEVAATDTVGGFYANGSLLGTSDLVQFPIAPAGSGSAGSDVTFTSDNTNVDAFLNNLPVSIRFVGRGLINPASQEGSVTDPVEFAPAITVNMPMSLATPDNPATYRDTVDSNMDFMPQPGDDQRVSEAVIRIGYTNKLPFRFNLNLEFTDTNHAHVTDVPLSTQDPAIIEPASVDGNGYVADPATGELVITLTQDQLNELYKARYLRIAAVFQTTNGQVVNVRADDAISLNIKANVTLESTVNN